MLTTLTNGVLLVPGKIMNFFKNTVFIFLVFAMGTPYTPGYIAEAARKCIMAALGKYLKQQTFRKKNFFETNNGLKKYPEKIFWGGPTKILTVKISYATLNFAPLKEPLSIKEN